jgi:L-lactate dehydrogenase complex protein LldG
MSSREKILKSIPKSSPEQERPAVKAKGIMYESPLEKFSEMVTSIGGSVISMPSTSGIREYIFQHFEPNQRIISVIPLVENRNISSSGLLHHYDNVEVTLIRANFGVAENGAVWVTENELPDRVLPFICQHLMVILNKMDIVHNMHEAYQRVDLLDYEFGTFIAGPSKTADIEQSLVLGAHGPKTMTVFLVDRDDD